MSRYSQHARNLYYSYPRRIEKGARDCVVIKLGEKKWRVIPTLNYYKINKPEKGRYFNHPRPEGWIVEAKKFPPDTSDFGKVCFPGDERVSKRELKCSCPDATATDIGTGRNWTHTRAGLFYPCKHIVAVLISENIEFIEDTLKNYNNDRRNQCGDPPSPPDTVGRVFKWRESIGRRDYISTSRYETFFAKQYDITSAFSLNVWGELLYSFSFNNGGDKYRFIPSFDIPSYTRAGNVVAYSDFGGGAIHTITSGNNNLNYASYLLPTPKLFPGNYLRSQFDALVDQELNAANVISEGIEGDAAWQEFYGNKFIGFPDEIINDYVIVDRMVFIPLS